MSVSVDAVDSLTMYIDQFNPIVFHLG